MEHQATPDEPQTWSTLPPLVRESWRRSAGYLEDPGRALPLVDLEGSALHAHRAAHPLAPVLPLLDQLLVQPAAEAGLITAVGDVDGHLLWVDGARRTLRRAETSAFHPGADWSERSIGTSAPGTALATGRGVQVDQAQHFAVAAHQFSCSALPVHCPHTGVMLGVVDITGGREAVATHSLPLIRAAIAAAEAELRTLPDRGRAPRLDALGRDAAALGIGSCTTRLSLRHAELLVLLTWHDEHRHPQGAAGPSAATLAEELFGEPGHEVALRAELVRLRRMLADSSTAHGLDLLSRPYRLSGAITLDAVEVSRALAAGDRSRALDLYAGELLPGSDAPGIVRLRRTVAAELREAVLQDGSPAEIWRYLQLPEAEHDDAAIVEALRTLPSDAPERALLVARAESTRP